MKLRPLKLPERPDTEQTALVQRLLQIILQQQTPIEQLGGDPEAEGGNGQAGDQTE